MHILLGSNGATGHMNPILRIGKGLLKQGHRVTLLTSRGWVEGNNGGTGKFGSEVHGMTLVPMDDGMTDNVAVDLIRIKEEHGLWLPRSALMRYCQIQEESIAAPLEKLHADDPIDYAVVDFFGIPWMKHLTNMGIDYCVNLPGPASMLWFCRVGGTEDWSWLPFATRMEFFILEQVVLAYVVQQNRLLSSLKPWLVNSFPELEDSRALPAHCRYCGSLADPPSGLSLEGELADFCERAAESGLPVICVSLGSLVKPDVVIINAICNGLAGGPWRVVWSLYQGGIAMLSSTEGDAHPSAGAQFWLAPWIPQSAVLARPECKLFLTHGGWGGLTEASAAGKPLLCLPFFGDQPENARLVERTGWGLALPDQKVSPLDAVKDPPEWVGSLQAAEVRTKAARILETPAFQEAAERMRSGAMRYGGQSAAGKMVEEYASLSRQGRLPKPVRPSSGLWACCS